MEAFHLYGCYLLTMISVIGIKQENLFTILCPKKVVYVIDFPFIRCHLIFFKMIEFPHEYVTFLCQREEKY